MPKAIAVHAHSLLHIATFQFVSDHVAWEEGPGTQKEIWKMYENCFGHHYFCWDTQHNI